MKTQTPDARGGSGCGASAITSILQHGTILCVYKLNISLVDAAWPSHLRERSPLPIKGTL